MIHWTHALPHGIAGHINGQLVIQIRKLGVGGWSAGWRNGMTWDVSDQSTQVTRQASRHFRTIAQAKAAAERALTHDQPKTSSTP